MRGRDADTGEMAEGRRMEADSEESPRVGAERVMIREYRMVEGCSWPLVRNRGHASRLVD